MNAKIYIEFINKWETFLDVFLDVCPKDQVGVAYLFRINILKMLLAHIVCRLTRRC